MANRVEPYRWATFGFAPPLQFVGVKHFLDAIAGDSRLMPMVFETRLRYNEEPLWLVGFPESQRESLANYAAINTNGTKLNVIAKGRHTEFRTPLFENKLAEAHSVTLSHASRSLNQSRVETIAQFLHSNLQSQLEEYEELVLQFAIREKSDYYVGTVYKDPVTGRLDRKSRDLSDDEDRRYDNPTFVLGVRVGVIANTPVRRIKFRNAIEKCFKTMETVHVKVKLKSDSSKDKRITKAIDLASIRYPHELLLNLCSRELMCLLAWPYDKVNLSSTYLHPKKLAPPNQYGCKESEAFGKSLGRSPELLSIYKNVRQYHTILTGASGAGKTTAMIHQIANIVNDGGSVIVDDPKGDLTKFLGHIKVDVAKSAEIVVFDLSDLSSVIGFNPFSLLKPDRSNAEGVAGNIISGIEKSAGGYYGNMMSDTLSTGIKTMSYMDNPTIPQIVPLLFEEDFRKNITEKLIREEPYGLGSFWKRYNAQSENAQQKSTDSSMRNIRKFTTSDFLLGTLGQSHPKFDFSEIFNPDKQHVIVLSLNSGVSGANVAGLLRTLFFNYFWSLVKSQRDVPEEERKRIYYFMDEAGEVLQSAMNIKEVFEQARSHNLCITVACQYLSQFGKAYEAATSNAANMIAFKHQQYKNCQDVARELGNGLVAEDVMELPLYNFYLKTPYFGKTVVMSGETIPLKWSINNANRLKAESREKYGVPIREVKAELYRTAEQAKTRNSVQEAVVDQRSKK
ncbi:hypothetical protein FACS189431_2010 [Alphaproteobacteria bacterium]|nr:hypothetical protein FACS189431_2010 [Alphaproteobacteria bacterium]